MPASAAGKHRAIFRQACELIPSHRAPKPARQHGVRSRAITPWSHVVSMRSEERGDEEAFAGSVADPVRRVRHAP